MKFDQATTNAPSFQFKEARRETPEFLAQTIVIIPLSLGVGLIVLIGWWFICLATGWNKAGALGVAGVVMIACVLFAFWRTFADQIYMGIETITGHDLNNDGFVGAPPEPQIVTIEITNPDNNNLQYLQIPDDLFQKLPMIARMLKSGKPFSEGAMTGSGRPLSRAEFHRLRDVFFERGLARWRDEKYPTQGVELTPWGKSVMRQLYELPDRTTHVRMRTPREPAALPEYSEGRWGDG